MITNKMLHNANKVAYIAQQYPEHKLGQIIALLGMPAIDINTAIWAATELGFIEEPNKATGEIVIGKLPDTWDFGQEVEDLKEALVYSFTELAKKETDLEETYLGNWTNGYPAHDVLIAMKQLLGDKVLAEYDLTDPMDLKSTYTFYTLYENGEQMWGRKQFETQPTGEEKPDNSDQVADAEAEQEEEETDTETQE